MSFRSPFHRAPSRVAPSLGSRSPWGVVDSIEAPAPGLCFVSTASHGGWWVSPELLTAMPPAARSADGWFEEDCEASLVALAFPAARGALSPADALAWAEGVARMSEYLAPGVAALVESAS